MRAALKSKAANRASIVQTKEVPSPIGGWNARDALAEMPVTDAVALDNFMPKASYVELRGGYVSHVTSGATDILAESGSELTTEGGDILATEDTTTTIVGIVKTLAVYSPLSGTNKMFAYTDQGVFDVSSQGAAGASLIARTNGKHQGTMFGDGTSNWRIDCNGVDKPLYYDGTTWTAVDQSTSPALTGFPGDDTTQFISVTAHQARLFFIPKASLSFWYLPPNAAGGALLEFDLSAQCKRGGYLMAMGSWTRDAGGGQDDVAVFITSEGEAIMYQGDNPSSASFWQKVGSFYVGKPLGRRCLTQYAGDLMLLTENGAFPLSAALQSAIVNYQYAISSKIEKAFTESARSAATVFGWEMTVYPAQQALLVNVPVVEDGLHYQYVMNTLTKAWCRFKAWDAETFAVFNRELYFARGSNVYKAWVGTIDGTDAIQGYGKQAFSNFGIAQLKTVTLFRPFFSTSGTLAYSSAVDIDFQESAIIGTNQAGTTTSGVWNVSQWNQAKWAGGLTTSKNWSTVAQWPGTWIAGKVQVSTNSIKIQWMASGFVFQIGGIV